MAAVTDNLANSLLTPIEMLYHWESSIPDTVFLRQPIEGQWREYSWREVGQRARSLAAFLQAQGFAPGSRIGLLAANCADWVVVDFAIMMAGYVSVPLYPGQDVESGRYILDHSEVQMIFLGQFDMSHQAKEMIGSTPSISIHGCRVDCDYQLEQIIESHAPLTESPVPTLDDLMTILYTSGTTGNPKGVMHAHGTPARVSPRICRALFGEDYLDKEQRFFSFLPLSHAAERMVVEMLALYSGKPVSFNSGLEGFADEIREVRPTAFFAVPRLWVKFKEGIDSAFSAEQQQQFTEEDKENVRKMLGLNDARLVITGSAPTPPDVLHWYASMGVVIHEGYSMTENFCDGCFNLPGADMVVGSVGKPLPDVEVKVTEEGELCFRSDGLMSGYYKNPQKTAEVLIDGWYHTGDSGRIDDEGRVYVTGRISEVFKTSKGKFIKPTRIESIFASLDELAQICVFGYGADQPMMMVSLSEVAKTKPVEEVQTALALALEKINADLPPFERVSQIFITPHEWSIDNGLLTPTMKLKRRAILDHFAASIEPLKGTAAVSAL